MFCVVFLIAIERRSVARYQQQATAGCGNFAVALHEAGVFYNNGMRQREPNND
tara:strand:- start:2817 stop:2975 length:159 start_codon:yes stop_codon:yes gene_type:complete